MAWKAKLKSIQDNSTPNDSVYITLEFSNGIKNFGKDYKIVPGNWIGEQSLKDLVNQELSKLESFDIVIDTIKSHIGKEITNDGQIK